MVGIFFVLWDVAANALGHWTFHESYILGVRFLGLPFEEIFFFLVMPYSCLFIYETVAYFHPERICCKPQKMLSAAAVFLACLGVVFLRQSYTCAVLAVSAATIFVVLQIAPQLFSSRRYWIFLTVTYIPFLVFNSALTSRPVVIYHAQAIWGFRVGTIPLEDFFYHFSLQTLYVLVYRQR